MTTISSMPEHICRSNSTWDMNRRMRLISLPLPLPVRRTAEEVGDLRLGPPLRGPSPNKVWARATGDRDLLTGLDATY